MGNIRLILAIFDYCKTKHKDGILMFLDFEKVLILSNGICCLKYKNN